MRDEQGNWDIDFADGTAGEEYVKELLSGATKVEVKTDRYYFEGLSGSLAVEYKCYGKPSGVLATDAEVFCWRIGKGALFVPVDALRAHVKQQLTKIKNPHTMGDYNKAVCLRMTPNELMKLCQKT